MANGGAHLHLVVTAFVTNPPTNAQQGEDWLRELVRLVDMEILFDAKALYCEDLGNEGVTGIVGLTTSHSSFHEWHVNVDEPFFQFDLYSCRNYDVETVFQHLQHWGMTRANYILLDRDPSLKSIVVLDQGVHTPVNMEVSAQF